MSAQVEQRHRDVAAITLGNARFELGRDRLNAQEWVAAALADTEAAARADGANDERVLNWSREARAMRDLRVEFAACVRALRMMSERFVISGDESGPSVGDIIAAQFAESALSGPLAKEILDA